MVWEERWHPLREEWVTIAAHRQNRPWQGKMVQEETTAVPEHSSDCFLCPGVTRVSGLQNPSYTGVYVFDNDYPCVGPDAPAELAAPTGIYQNRPAVGIARVVCYNPQHNSALGLMSVDEIRALMDVWREQYRDLARRPEINHVLVFENRGEVVGVSNPHPHCQIYATNFVFKTIADEVRVSANHWRETGRVLFQDIIAAERQDEVRIIAENDRAIAFVPYFARYAYDVCVAPKSTHRSVADLSGDELSDLAEVLKTVLVKFDNLWRAPFPYVMTLHQAPTDGGDYRGFHFYIAFHPPLRKPNLLKYMGGPETGGGSFISDTCPEEKAAELRAASEIHYTQAL